MAIVFEVLAFLRALRNNHSSNGAHETTRQKNDASIRMRHLFE